MFRMPLKAFAIGVPTQSSDENFLTHALSLLTYARSRETLNPGLPTMDCPFYMIYLKRLKYNRDFLWRDAAEPIGLLPPLTLAFHRQHAGLHQ